MGYPKIQVGLPVCKEKALSPVLSLWPVSQFCTSREVLGDTVGTEQLSPAPGGWDHCRACVRACVCVLRPWVPFTENH